MNVQTLIFILCLFSFFKSVYSQTYIDINIDPAITYQTMVGFGGSLAYYENWVTAHPNKAQIYEALFGELSLDILRLRNAHGYDPGMIDRASEFVQAAETVRGNPVSVLSTSWGPPAYLKSNNDRNNGGTLRYTVDDGVVEFDYPGFAGWWNSSLDEYNTNGIFPAYISIQNEPDWSASYESCRFNPMETINPSDTIAGYNKALSVVYDTIQKRSEIPKILGPETIGIGYNAVENYSNPMDLSKIHGIAHHLYHGVDENDPYSSDLFKEIGDYHPEIPHFQTEYSRGDWWSVGGLLYMSLCVENVVAYLYWDLGWDGGGLIDLDFPWDKSRWDDPTRGYTKTKDFYAFKQYSAFIHPGWIRVSAKLNEGNSVVSAFMSPDEDSAALVLINRSETEEMIYNIDLNNYKIDNADLYLTSENENCEFAGEVKDKLLSISPKTIATLSMSISRVETNIPVDSIMLNLDSDSIKTRLGSVHLQAEVYPIDASNKTLFWQVVENDYIASINQDGLLKANGIEDGVVKVRVSTTDDSGIYTDTIIAVINQVLVESISLSSPAIKIDEPGGSLQFTATVLPQEAFNKDLQWEIIAGSSIATITQEGLLQARGERDGLVTIRVSATDGSGIYKEITIQVTNQVAVSGLEISAEDTIINTLMGSLQLDVTVLPENASEKGVEWSVVDGADLASVDQNGLVTALGGENGTTIIRATSVADPGIYDEVLIWLENQVISVPNLQESKFSIWYAQGFIRYKVPYSTIDAGKMAVYSIEGKLIKLTEIPANKKEGELKLKLRNGIYLVKIQKGEQYFYSKIAVNH